MDTCGWQPDQIGVFAGALLYTQYGLIKRYLMKSISKQMEGDTDVSRDYEYTDWESVDDFAEIFMISVAGEPVLARGLITILPQVDTDVLMINDAPIIVLDHNISAEAICESHFFICVICGNSFDLIYGAAMIMSVSLTSTVASVSGSLLSSPAGV
jgi:hypothetical protein